MPKYDIAAALDNCARPDGGWRGISTYSVGTVNEGVFHCSSACHARLEGTLNNSNWLVTCVQSTNNESNESDVEFNKYLMDRDRSPYSKLLKDIPEYEVFPVDGFPRFSAVYMGDLQGKPYRAIWNFCVATRLTQEYTKVGELWTKMVGKGVHPRVAFFFVVATVSNINGSRVFDTGRGHHPFNTDVTMKKVILGDIDLDETRPGLLIGPDNNYRRWYATKINAVWSDNPGVYCDYSTIARTIKDYKHKSGETEQVKGASFFSKKKPVNTYKDNNKNSFSVESMTDYCLDLSVEMKGELAHHG